MDNANFQDRVEEFVSDNLTYLRSLVYKLGPDPSQADDIVQEALLLALRKADSFDARCELRPWLAGIVRNLCRRAWSDETRKDRLRKDALAVFMDNLADDPSSLWEQEALDAFERCLAKMGEQPRMIVNLRYNACWTSDSIAREIGTTASNVRVSLMRIKERLKECIERILAPQGGVA